MLLLSIELWVKRLDNIKFVPPILNLFFFSCFLTTMNFIYYLIMKKHNECRAAKVDYN